MPWAARTIAVAVLAAVFLHTADCAELLRGRPLRHAVPITTVAIMGAQHSGTNMMKAQMVRAFDARVLDHLELPSPGARDRRVLFKHWFHRTEDLQLADVESTLIVVMVRNPYDWLEGMYRFGHHTCKYDDRGDMLTREHFSQETRGCPRTLDTCINGCAELVDRFLPPGHYQRTNDRDSKTGLRFANILENRKAKLLHFRSWMDTFKRAPVLYVRYEDMVARPDAVMDAIAAAVNIERHSPRTDLEQYIKDGKRNANGEASAACYDYEMRKRIAITLGRDNEGFFGYRDLVPDVPEELTAKHCVRPSRSVLPEKCCSPQQAAKMRNVRI